MDDLGCLIFILLAIIIVAFILCMVWTIVEWVTRTELEDITIECEITHMDIDGGFYITVRNDDFTKTIRVTQSVFAQYQVGENVTVFVSGYRNLFGKEYFSYKVK